MVEHQSEKKSDDATMQNSDENSTVVSSFGKAEEKQDAKNSDTDMCKDANQNLLQFGESLTIQEVADFAQQARAIFNHEAEISLDISSLIRVDGAGIQLLCAVVKEAIALRLIVNWIGDSEALSNAAMQMGVVRQLRLSE